MDPPETLLRAVESCPEALGFVAGAWLLARVLDRRLGELASAIRMITPRPARQRTGSTQTAPKR